MSANLEAKKQLVNQMVEQFKNAKSIIFVDYKGISVKEDTLLRKNFRENSVSYKVYKNRLVQRALAEIGITDYDSKLLEGTTAVAFGLDEINPAKIFTKNSKDFKKMAVKFGIVNGKVMSKEEVEGLAKLPEKNVLIAMLLGTLQAPMSAFARALNEIANKNN